MIGARRRGLLTAFADRYVRWKVRSSFRSLWVSGSLPEPAAGPVLVYANHTSFWDGFVAHQLALGFGREPFALMEEVNLRAYPFLSWIGAFSIRRGEAASALESLRYAQRLLTRPKATVFIYPEGRIRPFGLPLELERGAAVLGRRVGCPMVPAAVRYVFFEDERPDILVSLGDAHAAESIEQMAERLGRELERVTAKTSPQGFRCLVSGNRGVAARWDAARRMLIQR